MFVSREATILHADLDAFYASVEQRDDPALRGRPVIVGGGVVLAASYEAKAYGVRTAMGGARGPPTLPPGDRRPAADVGLLGGEQGRLPRVRRHDAARRGAVDRRGLPRRARDASGSPARRPRSPRACDSDVRERVGLPITVGVARTKFLAKVASGVAKPDGLLVVPPGRRARLPAPAAGRAALGRRPGDRAEAPRARHPHGGGRRGRRGGGARRDARSRRRAGTSTRSRTTATSRPRAARSPATLDRLAASARPAPSVRARRSTPSLVGLVDRVTRRMRRRRARRAHRRAPAALRRLLARDPFAHGDPADRQHGHDPRRGARTARRGEAR